MKGLTAEEVRYVRDTFRTRLRDAVPDMYRELHESTVKRGWFEDYIVQLAAHFKTRYTSICSECRLKKDAALV